MIKEPKNVDFYTTGKTPSAQDFARISDWIKKDKQKHNSIKRGTQAADQKHIPKHRYQKIG